MPGIKKPHKVPHSIGQLWGQTPAVSGGPVGPKAVKPKKPIVKKKKK